MNHPPFPPGATGREIRVVQELHQAAGFQPDRRVRSALSGALDLIVELIEERGRRRDLQDQWDRPHDGG